MVVIFRFLSAWVRTVGDEQRERGDLGEREQGVRERESERRGREEAAEKLREGGRDRFRVFFSFPFILGRVGSGWGGHPQQKNLIPENRPDPTGFSEFQPEPAKISIKSARIGLVGSGGFCPPLPFNQGTYT
jgi:hypothetical protein